MVLNGKNSLFPEKTRFFPGFLNLPGNILAGHSCEKGRPILYAPQDRVNALFLLYRLPGMDRYNNFLIYQLPIFYPLRCAGF